MTRRLHALIQSGGTTAILGLGKTGRAVLAYLYPLGVPLQVLDSGLSQREAEQIGQDYPGVSCRAGAFPAVCPPEVSLLVVSPGVPLDTPMIQSAVAREVPITNEVGLFFEVVQGPVYAITGSNGKTTVTHLFAAMLAAAGKDVVMCGNVGTPVLSVLGGDHVDRHYVLELSSFQLECLESVPAAVSVLLNISPDHMDRHGTLANYLQIKQRIYAGAQSAVINGDDPRLAAGAPLPDRQQWFTLSAPDAEGWGRSVLAGQTYLTHGEMPHLATRAALLSGEHHDQNNLAALSMASLIGLPLAGCCDVLRTFAGVPHRCAYVDTVQGVLFYNDSKATNPGAVIAALATLRAKHPEAGCWIILGGDAKAADLSELLPVLLAQVRHALLIGKDADRFAACCDGVLPYTKCDSLTDAVRVAYDSASAGDVVLLSPACASLDAFESYAHRGTVFVEAVKALAFSVKSQETEV